MLLYERKVAENINFGYILFFDTSKMAVSGTTIDRNVLFLLITGITDIVLLQLNSSCRG